MLAMMVFWSTAAAVSMLAFVFWGTFATMLPDTDECKTCFEKPDVGSQYYSENYYFPISFKGNWHKARQFCVIHGMTLATIKNKIQNDEVIELLKRNGVASAWIGLNDLGEEGRYSWVADGNYVKYAPWAPGQPDQGQCVFVRATSVSGDDKVGWYNADCGTDNSFVCNFVG